MADWYYMAGGDRRGPVSGPELKKLAERGELGGDDLVWREGLPAWVAARKVPKLIPAPPELDVFDLLEEGPAQTAPPPRRPDQRDRFFEPDPAQRGGPDAPPPRLKSRVAEARDPGLSAFSWVLFPIGFLVVPAINVIVSSVLYYAWRGDYPRSARQINRLGFAVFGVHVLALILIVSLMPKPENLGGPVSIQAGPGFDGMGQAGPLITAGSGDAIYWGPFDAFSIRIPPGRWSIWPDITNPVAEAMWKLQGQDAFVTVIHESTELPLDQLRQAALANFSSQGTQPRVLEENSLEIPGGRAIRMVIECEPKGMPMTFCNTYFVGPRGSLQLLGFAPRDEFARARADIERFLDGLEISPGEPPTTSSFESPSGSYTLSLPEGKWRPASVAIFPDAEGVWTLAGHDAHALIIHEPIEMTSEELKDAALSNFRDQGAMPRISEETVLDLDGKPFVRVVFEIDGEGEVFKYLNAYHSGPGGSFQISTWSSPAEFDQLRPELEAFLGGVRIHD